MSKSEVRYGPNRMPLEVNGQCAILLNSTHIFMAGGFPRNASLVFVMEISTGDWTRLPAMKTFHMAHACGLYQGKEVRTILTSTKGKVTFETI